MAIKQKGAVKDLAVGPALFFYENTVTLGFRWSLPTWRIDCSCDAVPVTARGPSNRYLKVAVNFILINCTFPSFFFLFVVLRTEPPRTCESWVSSLPLNYTFIFLSLLLYFLSLGYLETLLYMIFSSVYSSQLPNTNSNLYTMNLDTYHQPQLSQRCHTVQQ